MDNAIPVADIVAFIRARLAEDERDKQHIVPPALWQRWLAGIEAKRRIVDLCVGMLWEHEGGPDVVALGTLRLLATEWSTHEVYLANREAWEP